MADKFKTKVIKIKPDDEASKFEPAVNAIKSGDLVAFPTETVYGLGGNALDKSAVSKIFKAKGRPANNPLILHVSKFEDIPRLVTHIPDDAYELSQAFWPGPLTIIMKRSKIVPKEVSAGLDSVAIRMPDHKIAKSFIELTGVPIAAPSANKSGAPSPTEAKHVLHDLDGKIPYILDGGPSLVGVESTVISLLEDTPRLLRPGVISAEELMEVLGNITIDPAIFAKPDIHKKLHSPGLQYKHYAPEADLKMFKGTKDEYVKYCNENDIFAFCFDEDMDKLMVPFLSYGSVNDPKDLAKNVFAALRRLDDLGVERAIVHAPKKDGVYMSVYNRLLRSCEFEVIENVL